MLAHITDKIEEEIVLHPVVIVAYLGTVDGVVEVEELGQLLADAVDVVLHLVDGEELALGSLEGGVAYHAGGTTHDGQGLVACHLKVLEEHDTDQMAYVERIGSGVDTDVGRGDFFVELFFGPGHDVVYHTAPLEFLYKVCLHRMKVY